MQISSLDESIIIIMHRLFSRLTTYLTCFIDNNNFLFYIVVSLFFHRSKAVLERRKFFNFPSFLNFFPLEHFEARRIG